MSKVSSKLQVTIPKAIVNKYAIHPGDELHWKPAGESLRVVLSKPTNMTSEELSLEARLKSFDEATQRQRQREAILKEKGLLLESKPAADRGWTREELYTRDLSD
jgi:bifunctional DNA-binding transcriptional regulator/antitoxin component of YhaV-PrlF toxin-antitoxin module